MTTRTLLRVALAASLAVLITGVGMVWVPAALVVGGAIGVGLSLLALGAAR